MPIRNYYINMPTESMIKIAWNNWIAYYSKENHVPINLAKAISQKESGLNPFAIRFEPHLKNAKWYKRTIPSGELNDEFAYCSYGYMQVLYGIARSHGFKGTPMELFNPRWGVAYGCIHLSKLLKRYRNTEDAISSYNQGSPRKDKFNNYINQSYVDNVLQIMEQF